MHTVRIDDLSEVGTELTDEELAGLAGGMPPADGQSSKTLDFRDGYCDADKDF